jgi:hypothetical protein
MTLENNQTEKQALTAFEFATLCPPSGMPSNDFEKPIWKGEGTFDKYLASISLSNQLTNNYTSVENSLNPTQLRLFKFLRSKISDPENAEKIMSKHHFVSTGLMSLLEEARRNDILPCLEFFWLKNADFTTWYALQSVGRSTAFIEAAGIQEHWKEEKLKGRPISQPKISITVNSLELLLTTYFY